VDVRQIVNTLELMEFFAERGRPASLAEISRHFGWPRSSTFNLLGTLANRGYLYEPRAKQGYYPSPKWLPLINKIDQAAPIAPELQELVQTICERTSETTALAGISGMRAVFLCAAESSQAIRYTAHVGKTVPLHATATGRALLAQLPQQTKATILRRTSFERYTPTSLMSVEAVEREIALSLNRGYFEGNAEYSRDLGGYALGLNHRQRQLALLVAGPFGRVAPMKDDILRIMQEEISRHVPDAPTT
jgi:DNA-binding IclR family transcriptional regulator